MSGEPAVTLERVSKTYAGADSPSLEDVSMVIRRGEKLGLFGPNGAGKTTLISIICGILSSSSGQIHFHDKEEDQTSKVVRHRMGYVPQDLAFYETLSPKQNLAYFGAMHGIRGPLLRERIELLLERAGLAKEKDKKAGKLSGGMKRRLNLAIGLLHEPDLLVLDEPTVGIDVHSKKAIMDYLDELNAAGMTMLYSSHHMAEAQQFCDRVVLLDRGRIIARGQLSELLAQHGVGALEQLFLKLTVGIS